MASTFIKAGAGNDNLGICTVVGIGSQPVMAHQLSHLKLYYATKLVCMGKCLKQITHYVAIILQNKYKVITYQ